MELNLSLSRQAAPRIRNRGPTRLLVLGDFSGRPPAGPAAAPAATVIEAFIRSIVAPHIVPDIAPQQASLFASVDAAITDQMRAPCCMRRPFSNWNRPGAACSG